MNNHPLADILPVMSDKEFASLVESIRREGQLDPIVTLDGLILDGRHRFRACAELGIAPNVVAYSGNDPVGYVWAKNGARRNMNKTQLGAVAVGFLAYEQAEAKKRQGARTDIRENFPESDEVRARDVAGKRVGVSGKHVETCAFVIANGVPELVAKLKAGTMSANLAKQIAVKPKKKQSELLALPNTKAIRHALKTSRNIAQAKMKPEKTTSATAVDVVPGTPIVKTLLARLENIASEIERSGLGPESFASKFLQEFDWNDPIMRRRFAYCEAAVKCLVSLDLATKKAARTAA